MNNLKKGDKIKLESGMEYEIMQTFNGEIYDLKALQPQFEWMPNFYPFYYSIKLRNYEVINTKNPTKMKTDKDRIKQVFIEWFENKPDGHEFKLHEIITHARNRTTLYYRHDDTFRRYLFQLREKGLVSFECINRGKSLYKVLK